MHATPPLPPASELLRFFSHVPSPWQQLAAAAAPSPQQQHAPSPSDDAASELALAALRALQLEPGLAAAWHAPAVLPLITHRLPAARWAAAQVAGAQLRMGEAALTVLMSQRLSEEELFAARRQWEGRLAAAALERARWWLGEPPAAGWGTEAAAQGDGKAAAKEQRRKSRKQRQRQEEGGEEGEERDGDRAAGGGPPLPPSSGFVELCGLEVPSRSATAAGPAPPSVLVRVPAAAAALEAAALALCQRQPLLLEGPPGSGKTAVARELARATGNAASAFWLHLDDQMDAKSLLGAYTCTPVPGEFAWQPGPLARAVVEGRWVVIEGLDAAPADVVAALAPLLESGSLHVPSRAQVLHAAPGFQLIATVATVPALPPSAAGGGHAAGAVGGGGGGAQELLGGMWARVRLEAPSDAEQLEILGGTFPPLAPLLPAALAAAHLVELAAGHAAPGGGGCPDARPASAAATAAAHAAAAWRGQAAACLRVAGVRPGELALQLQRHGSLRDLVKWCRRMADTHAPLLSRALRSSGGAPAVAAAPAPYILDATKIDPHVREAAFAEAADLFTGQVAAPAAKLRLLGALAALWALPETAAAQYEELGKPHVSQAGGEVQVRRSESRCLPLVLPRLRARGGLWVGRHQQAVFGLVALQQPAGPEMYRCSVQLQDPSTGQTPQPCSNHRYPCSPLDTLPPGPLDRSVASTCPGRPTRARRPPLPASAASRTRGTRCASWSAARRRSRSASRCCWWGRRARARRRRCPTWRTWWGPGSGGRGAF
jgi:midasin